MRSLLVAAALLALPSLSAGGTAEGDPTAAKARFERLKGLAGTWKGTAGHGDQRSEATVVWRVTAAGHAVFETMFAGTPHEMVTVYTLDGDDLVLTHYCAAGNQPTMKAQPGGDPDTIVFDFVRGGNMRPDDMHMHSATITFAGADELRADWTSWKDGKPLGPPARFALTRQR